MAKKKKNPKHAESVKRKELAKIEMSKLGLELSDNLAAVGFVFNHLSVSHLVYCGLNSINQLCKEHIGVDICIFSQHIIAPCVIPLCSVFNISELTRWNEYPLITTTIGTTIDALATNTPIIYHYAFDPEFIGRTDYDSEDLRKAFCDPRVKVIVRHDSHVRLIEAEFGIHVCEVIIPDCDAIMLTKFVLKEMKDGKREKTTDENGQTRTKTRIT